jgi:hypothetical protein
VNAGVAKLGLVTYGLLAFAVMEDNLEVLEMNCPNDLSGVSGSFRG